MTMRIHVPESITVIRLAMTWAVCHRTHGGRLYTTEWPTKEDAMKAAESDARQLELAGYTLVEGDLLGPDELVRTFVDVVPA